MSATYLEVYSKLAKALSNIEDNVFRSPLTNKKRKENFFSCPKSSTMKYLPPAVKEIASTTAKSADSKLHNNPEILPENDNFVFAHTIRVLLSDLAITISQALIEPKALYALGTAKNATRRAGLSRPFQMRQQTTQKPYSDNGFAHAQQTQTTASTAPKVFLGGVAAESEGIGRFLLESFQGIQDSVQKSEFRQAKGFDKNNFIGFRGIVLDSNTEFNVFKNTFKDMGKAVISVRDIRIKFFYRLQQHSMGKVAGYRFYFGLWAPSETLTHINAKNLFAILYAPQLRSVVDVRFALNR
ncbi:hypothetical protein BB561_005439 [Smittium simulii]|uniref:Uncharacterized protein n=1 Tax=Smittium simulii TaxID=133385 RepID=A0A2T9YAE0_9FUNG|nr:hypothetical protein BB561_005439 [Smittium simulii]